MGRFRDNQKSGGFRGRDSGRSRFSDRGESGGFSRGRDSGRSRFSDRGRDSGRSRFSDRGRSEMFDAVCSKCGKDCQLPFKPMTDKPVFCSDCFRKEDGGGRSERFSDSTPRVSSGISQEQFNQLNAKLDKIIEFLDNLEFENIENDEEEDTQ